MTRKELKQLIKEELSNADYNKIFKIAFYEGSYQYNVSHFIGKSIKDAEKEALNELGKQYRYRKASKDLWAEIYEPTNWKEVSRKSFEN